MNTKSKNSLLEIEGLQISLTQKRIKNLHIGVYPPEGQIRVSAPLYLSQAKILETLHPRIDWMKIQQQKFLMKAKLAQQNEAEGPHLHFLGKRYPFEVKEAIGARNVMVEVSGTLMLYAKPNLTQTQKQQSIKKWYQEELVDQLGPMVERWSQKLGVKANSWNIRHMKSKWGSCNITEKKIVFNLELAKHSVECIEYVVAHELIHLLEPSHNARFKRLMTQAVPNWKVLKHQLDAIPFTR